MRKRYSPRFSSPAEKLRYHSNYLKNGCIVMTGCLDAKGYGRLEVDGALVFAHRLSWELEIGPIPKGMAVLHKCDTPACINAEHLLIGTQIDNIKDMVAKGRHPHGIKHGRAKLTISDVHAIRAAQDTQVKIAEQFGVSQRTVSLIKLRQTWGHLP